MSLAEEFRAQTIAVSEQRAKDKELAKEAERQKEMAHQQTIFERAKEVYENCLAKARAMRDRGAYSAELRLCSTRTDKKYFDPYRNAWDMAVIALQENGFKADLVFREDYFQGDELSRPGTDHVPYIELSWEK